MKISEIKALNTKKTTKDINEQSNVKDVDGNFFKELYQFCINSIEKVDDEFILKIFKPSSRIDQVLIHQDDNNKIMLDFCDGGDFCKIYTYLLDNTQNFDFHKFGMFISLNPNIEAVCLQVNSNEFYYDDVKKIFGEYFIGTSSGNVFRISLEFFTEQGVEVDKTSFEPNEETCGRAIYKFDSGGLVNFNEGIGYYDDGMIRPEDHLVPKIREGIIPTARFKIPE